MVNVKKLELKSDAVERIKVLIDTFGIDANEIGFKQGLSKDNVEKLKDEIWYALASWTIFKNKSAKDRYYLIINIVMKYIYPKAE